MASAGQSQLGYFGRKSFNEGLEQGRAEVKETLSRTLVKQLELRFGALSAGDAARVAAADTQQLEQAFQRVLTARSVDEVFNS